MKSLNADSLSDRMSLKEYKFLSKNRPKYNNTKVNWNGKVYDSKDEALYAQLIKMDPDVDYVTEQPKFLLQSGFSDQNFNGEKKTHRPIYYKPDFAIKFHSDVRLHIIDVKSESTQKNSVYRLKVKLFRFLYPDLKFFEVFMRKPTIKEKEKQLLQYLSKTSERSNG